MGRPTGSPRTLSPACAGVLGDEHPDTLRAGHHLAAVPVDLGEHDQIRRTEQ
jgi:hypothetical protein